MKVRMSLFLFLSLFLFYGPILALADKTAAENKIRQADKSHVNMSSKKKWSVRIADSFINRHPASEIFDSVYCGKWTSEQGVMLEALRQLWLSTHKTKYLTYIKSNIDMFVGGDGSIRTYNYNDFNLENISTGRQLLFLYSVTKERKYKIAADTLMRQLEHQPRTKTGGFCHKKAYPDQMQLESLNMCGPFYAQYSKMFKQNKNFTDIARQFKLIIEETLDSKAGLLFRAQDKNLQGKRTDSETGIASDLSARALGSYAMALVDVLVYFPKNHPERRELINILRNLSEALMKVKDENPRLWYRTINQGAGNGNYPEKSAGCMLGYALAKGTNDGYLDKKYMNFAKETFSSITGELAAVDKAGSKELRHASCETWTGGKPCCEGNCEINMDEIQRMTTLKELGSFILLTIELEKAKVPMKEKLFSSRK